MRRLPGSSIIGTTLLIASIALLVDAAFGYPAWVFARIGHPVSWIGALIVGVDRRLNRDTLPERRRRLNGVLALLPIAVLPALLAWGVQHLMLQVLPRWLAIGGLGLLAGAMPAQRSLWQHVRAVLTGLRAGGVAGGRTAVSHIVGRDPASLDEAGVVRAAIESLGENLSDGVVAPLLWCALLGLPGITFYKAVNTGDSMIGHLTPRHASFGWAAARLDDLVNLPASRLSALWLLLGAGASRRDSAGGAFRVVRADARRHRSPNAGWPEAAMAGALGLRLAGPRLYAGIRVQDGWIGNGRDQATANDLERALALYCRACLIQAVVLLGLALLVAW